MDTLAIIEKFYKKGSDLYNMLVSHSEDVTRKALDIVRKHPELHIDAQFVSEAGMLHDIGVLATNAPSIGCHGLLPYVTHGYIGRGLLDELGYEKHALVCERHTGSGISKAEIQELKLPIPHRDMLPISMEEKVICFSDCFFSKTRLGEEKDLGEVIAEMARFGQQAMDRFEELCILFL